MAPTEGTVTTLNGGGAAAAVPPATTCGIHDNATMHVVSHTTSQCPISRMMTYVSLM